MIASLPMYDRPEMQGANDRFWAAIRNGMRAAGMEAPDALTRIGAPIDHWTDPGLVFSQTCGMPYRALLHGRVALIGTPDVGLPGCLPGHYRSLFIARRDDARWTLSAFEGARFVFNETTSQSGWAAPLMHLGRIGVQVQQGLPTGAHRDSARAVAEGAADLTAIDALTWAQMRRWDWYTDALHVVDETEPTPTLPYITARAADADAMFGIVAKAIADLSDGDRYALQLHGLVRIPASDYLAVPTPPTPAAAASAA